MYDFTVFLVENILRAGRFFPFSLCKIGYSVLDFAIKNFSDFSREKWILSHPNRDCNRDKDLNKGKDLNSDKG